MRGDNSNAPLNTWQNQSYTGSPKHFKTEKLAYSDHMEEGVESMCWPSASPSASPSLWFPVWASSQRRWASAECCACQFAPVPPPAVKEQRQYITVNTTQMFYIECSFATTHITFLWWRWRPLPSVLFFSNVKLKTSTEGFWASIRSHHPNTPAGSSPSS